MEVKINPQWKKVLKEEFDKDHWDNIFWNVILQNLKIKGNKDDK